MNRGDAIFEISRIFGLDDTVGSDERTLQERWSVRAVRDVLIKTHCYLDIGTMVLQAGVSDYRTDTSVLAVDEITIPGADGTPTNLEVIAMSEITRKLAWAQDIPQYGAIEGTLLRVAPIPSSAVTLTYIYVPTPTAMTDDSHDWSNVTYGGIAEEYDDCVLAYMMWQAALYDDKNVPLDPKDYRNAYEGLCTDVRKQQRRKAGRGLRPAKVGYPNRHGWPLRNDTWPPR